MRRFDGQVRTLTELIRAHADLRSTVLTRLAGIVRDATGNLIISVAGSEVARFAGDAGHNLQGLAWNDWDEADANLNIGSTGTKVARYVRIGNTVHYYWHVVLGGTGISVGAVEITLPVAPASHYIENVSIMGQGILLDSGTTTYHAAGRLDGSGTQVAIRTYATGGADSQTRGLSSTSPHTWAAGDTMTMQGTYEAAV